MRNFIDNDVLIVTVLIVVIALLMFFFLGRADTPRKTMERKSHRSSSSVFGIDVSHYQGLIKWNHVRNSHHPIKYVFIRATMGVDGKDKQFSHNWRGAKKCNYLRGAYHYYRPTEDGTSQFDNFKRKVKLKPGDLPPVLDIEDLGGLPASHVRKGVLNWLKQAEEHYGVKPIVYTGRTFYQHHLHGYVDDYPLWIASYSGKHMLGGIDWHFHQFTEKVRVTGIQHETDGNDFRGSLDNLSAMCIK